MIFIFGGAYQGKLEYAKKTFGVKTVCDCSGGNPPDFSSDAICGIEGFVLDCVKNGRDAVEFFRCSRDAWQDRVLICTDVSQGIVPVEAHLRALREMNGRLMLYLAAEAEQVVRVFCGLGKREK